MRLWGKGGKPPSARGVSAGQDLQGILIFENTSQVIRAERVLKSCGLAVVVKGPPPAVRTGCDMVIEFPLGQELEVSRILEAAGVRPLEMVAVGDSLLEPVSLFQVKELGGFLMVKAANMKLTVEKATRLIVNVSGGGCPDVPYLAEMLVGRTLDQAPHPRELGQTLCGYALGLAFEEARRICPGS